MFSTGPMFLTLQYVRYGGPKGDVVTLPSALYSGSHGAFFQHYAGSSWHGADSALLLWLYSHLAAVLALASSGLAVAGCWCAVLRGRKRKCY